MTRYNDDDLLVRLARLACFTALTLCPITPAKAQQWAVDNVADVRINWDTFEDQGIPSTWKDAFKDAVINAYTRWMQVGGARVGAKWQGYTTRTTPNSNEILIRMNEAHAAPRLASCFTTPGVAASLVFHRKDVAGGTPWNFVPYWAQSGEYDMQGLLMHEFGHCLGFLTHTDGARDTMNGGYSWTRQRFGPFSNDVARMQDLYGRVAGSDIDGRRSTDDGATWNSWVTLNLGAGIRNDMSAVKDSSQIGVFYSSTANKPHYIWGDSSGTFGPDVYFGGENSAYGVSADGENGKFMFAWVDGTNDNMEIKVVRSTNAGASWVYCGSTSAYTYASPAIHYVSGSTWILAYSRLDWSDRTRTGDIVVRKSTNDCASWSSETDITSLYNQEISPAWLIAESGVAVTEHDTGKLISFAWAPNYQNYTTDRLRIIGLVVDTNFNIVGDEISYSWGRTRSRPALTTNDLLTFRTFRKTNSATNLGYGSSSRSTLDWLSMFEVNDGELSNSGTYASPAMAADNDQGNVHIFFVDQ